MYKVTCKCKKCGILFETTFTLEDITDGCTPLSVHCLKCLEDRVDELGVTPEDVEQTALLLGLDPTKGH